MTFPINVVFPVEEEFQINNRIRITSIKFARPFHIIQKIIKKKEKNVPKHNKVHLIDNGTTEKAVYLHFPHKRET